MLPFISGIIVIDKPENITSAGVTKRIKRIPGVQKTGHTGTLDPFATGLLPICFGEATKFSADLLEADKGYEATETLDRTRYQSVRRRGSGGSSRLIRESGSPRRRQRSRRASPAEMTNVTMPAAR